MVTLFYVFLILLGFALLLCGANYLIAVSNFLVKKFGLSPVFVGATVLAVGTSLPEIGVSLYSASIGAHDACFSNITGSNIFNMCIVLGVCSLIRPITIKREYFKNEIFQHAAIGILLYSLARGGTISRISGIILVAIYSLFVVSWYLKNKKNTDTEIFWNISNFKAFIMLISSIPMFFLGTKLVVDNGLLFAAQLGLSKSFIGFTLMAVGTCLPELTTGIIASLRGQNDYVLGNVFASNLCNISLGLGLSASLTPLKIENIISLNTQLIALLIITAIVTLFTYTKYIFSKTEGIIVVLLYTFVLKILFN